MLKGRLRPPAHPGAILKRHYFDAMPTLTITELARVLNVSRKTISEIIHERVSVTPDMALRLSRAFQTTPQFWLNLQQNYDLWKIQEKHSDWKKVQTVV